MVWRGEGFKYFINQYYRMAASVWHFNMHAGVSTWIIVRESALEVDAGRAILCRTRESNPHQYFAWLLYLWHSTTHIHTHMLPRRGSHACTHTQTLATHTHMHARMHAHTQVLMHVQNTHIHTHIHACKHARTHARTHAHTHTHTHCY